MNSKLATVEAARKLLKQVYCDNQEAWERFKEIKKKKNIVT